MNDPAVILILTVQTTLVGVGLMILPWGGARLDDAAHASRNLRRRLRRLAVRVTRDGPPPRAERVIPSTVARIAA